MISGHLVFHGYATHGVPLSIGLMVLEGKRINWREYVDAALENGWLGDRIIATLEEGMRDADWPASDLILSRARHYLMRLAND